MDYNENFQVGNILLLFEVQNERGDLIQKSTLAGELLFETERTSCGFGAGGKS